MAGAIKVIPAAFDLLPVFRHGAAGGIHVIAVGVVAEPSGEHLAIGVQIVISVVQIQPSCGHLGV